MKLSTENFKVEALAFLRRTVDFWVDKNSWIFVSIWVILGIFAFSVWYLWVYAYNWSPERQEAYQKEKGKGVVLDEKKLRNILDEMSRRSAGNAESSSPVRDIFDLKK